MKEKKTESQTETLARLKDEFDLDSKAFSDTMKRIEYDLRFTLGTSSDHWDSKDDAIRGENRARLAIPLLGKYIDRVVGKFLASPFGIVVEAETGEEINQAKAKVKQGIVRGIECKSNGKQVYANALKHACACGYGYFYATLKTVKGKLTISLEIIDDPRAVTLDRNAKCPEGSDAQRAFYSSIISLSEAKRLYGSDVVDAHGDAWLSSAKYLGGSSDCPVVHAWEMQNDSEEPYCKWWKIVGNKIVDEGELPISAIPLFRVGARSTITQNKAQFIGIAHNAIGTNRLVDNSASMLLERLALSPRPSYVAPIEAIADDPQAWTSTNTDNRGVRTYKAFTQDGKPIPKPERENDLVQVQDVSTVMQEFAAFIDQIVGIETTPEKVSNETAEGALIRERSSETVEAEVFMHLESAIISAGRVLCELIDSVMTAPKMMPIVNNSGSVSMVLINPEEITGFDYGVSVEAGAMRQSKRKEELRKALAIQSVLGADSKLVWGTIAKNTDDMDQDVKEAMENASKAHAELIKGAGAPNAEMIAQQAQQSQEQLMQLQAQLDQANLYIQQQDAKIFALEQDSQAQIIIKQMDSDTKIYIEQMKQAGQDQRLQAQLEADYQANRNKMLGELLKLKDAQPTMQLVQGARPDYNAVGGMRNNF